MCGIVGYIGNKKVSTVLLDGLRRLEYRGYDSAGIALIDNGKINVVRSAGKLRDLEDNLSLATLDGSFGLGHTRWATHGRPTEENAHPHRDCSGSLVVVHNGIIENYKELKKELRAAGHTFKTETDTEVIAHLIEEARSGEAGLSLEEALRKAGPRLPRNRRTRIRHIAKQRKQIEDAAQDIPALGDPRHRLRPKRMHREERRRETGRQTKRLRFRMP
jgi:glucosamine--fructose-6-phosphate aminotransferase (isomerizing)